MEIKINDVGFSYDSESQVLDGVTLDISGPQVVSILGPNGVGKSTLMHCMNKILSPTMGTVYYDGRDISDYTLREMARHVGYVPCTSSDSFPLTVVDTVLLGRHPHAGWKTTDRDLEVVYETLEKLGIQDMIVVMPTVLEEHTLKLTKQWPKGTPVSVTYAIDNEGVLHVNAFVDKDVIDFDLKITGVKNQEELEASKEAIEKTVVE